MSTFDNFVQCRVASPIAASTTSLELYAAVAPYNLPPETGGVLVLTDSPGNPSRIEVIRYASRSALGLYGVERGQEGTTAIEWTGPVYCYQALMAGDFQALLDTKIDKVTGKALSANDFTDGLLAKLNQIAEEATKNRNDSENADKVHTHTMAQVTGLDTALDGKASNTDPRFSDAREWTATTISQSEAEKGTATTRRAFTAERLRQGITAWFTGISGAIGRTILGRGTSAEVRGDLGLGTAATRNVGTADGDVMEVGAFGAGYTFPATVLDANKIADQVGNKSGVYPYMSNSGSVNVPHTYVYIQQLFYSVGGNVTQIAYGYNIEKIWIRYRFSGTWTAWKEVGGSIAWGNVTGQPATATRWPTWAEVTSKPTTFAPTAHTHTWDQVTGIPATATRWPTPAEAGAAPVSHTHTAAQVTGLSDAATTSVATIRAGTAATANTLTDSGWSTLTLVNGFTHHPDAPLQVRKAGQFVYIRGLIKRTTPPAGLTKVATLPTGYRPNIGTVIHTTVAADNFDWKYADMSAGYTGDVNIGLIGLPIQNNPIWTVAGGWIV